MSYERLALALLHGRQYYGPALRSLQGVTDRHRCMEPVVRAAIERGGKRPLRILEIGSWAGASAVSWAVALKALSPGGRLICVDTWRPYFDPNVESEQIYKEMNEAARRGDVLPLFLHNIRAAGVSDIVEYKVGATSDVLPQLEAASFDIIYIDGSHALDDVLGDLSQAARLIRDEGIVCGDDLELQSDAIDPAEHAAALKTGRDYVWAGSGAHYHPGVTEAVARLLGPVFTWNGFWASQRRGSQWEWLEVAPGALPSHIADSVSGSERDRGDQGASSRIERYQPPLLVREGYRGFNIVKHQSRWYAISQQTGPLDLEAMDLTELLASGRAKVADSHAAVEQLVDEHPLETAKDAPPGKEFDRGAEHLTKELEDLRSQRDRLLANVSTLEQAVIRARNEASAKDELAGRERGWALTLEKTIDELAARLQDRESAASSLNVEVAELKAWIQELQARLVRGNR